MSLETAVNSGTDTVSLPPTRRSWLGRTLNAAALTLGLGAATLALAKVEAYADNAIQTLVVAVDQNNEEIYGSAVQFVPPTPVNSGDYQLGVVTTPGDDYLWLPPGAGELWAGKADYVGVRAQHFVRDASKPRLVVMQIAKHRPRASYLSLQDLEHLKEGSVGPIYTNSITFPCLDNENMINVQFLGMTGAEQSHILDGLHAQADSFVVAGLPMPANQLYNVVGSVDGEVVTGMQIYKTSGPAANHSLGQLQDAATGLWQTHLGQVYLNPTSTGDLLAAEIGKETSESQGIGNVSGFVSCRTDNEVREPSSRDYQNFVDTYLLRQVVKAASDGQTQVTSMYDLSLDPTVAVQPTTWGGLKGLYR